MQEEVIEAEINEVEEEVSNEEIDEETSDALESSLVEIEIEDDLNAISEALDLSEENQEKAKTIFKAAVQSKVSEVEKELKEHFESELQDARQEVKLKGNVERAAAEMPGIVEHRFNQLQEIEAILNYLNIELRRLRSSFFKKYLENYQRSLSSRDVDRYVDGEADVVDYEKIINEFALLRNKWLGVLKALDQKQWQITNVVKLRVAGMEDARL